MWQPFGNLFSDIGNRVATYFSKMSMLFENNGSSKKDNELYTKCLAKLVCVEVLCYI